MQSTKPINMTHPSKAKLTSNKAVNQFGRIGNWTSQKVVKTITQRAWKNLPESVARKLCTFLLEAT